jgi:hypothetical protein
MPDGIKTIQEVKPVISPVIVNPAVSNGFWAYIKDACSDGTNASVSRIISLICVPTTILIPLFLWIFISIHDGKMADINGSVIGFMGAANTLVLGAQNLNKREETRQNG